MDWLNSIVDKAMARKPEGEIIVSSGVSPSGTYHLGTLREVLTAEVVMLELKRRGRESRHLHIVDDLDVFRKVPAGVPAEFEQYLGKPLCDVPAPDGSQRSYADYYLQDLIDAAQKLHLQMEVIRSHKKYREGFFVPAIERTLEHVQDVRTVLEEVSGRSLDDQWSPIQVIEDGYLKNRQFLKINSADKTLEYVGKEKSPTKISYANGSVKLSWRVDWPSRWWLLGVDVEPFGRDHATKGGSYDTGKEIARKVFDIEAPLPVPYDFINRVGETKKMSKSAGNVITAAELLSILPPEIIWYFILRSSPDKQLFFGEGETLLRLFDEFAALLAKKDKTDQEKQLTELCLHDIDHPTVSNIPFSHLVASYQAALKDVEKTLEVLSRTEYKEVVDKEGDTVRAELAFIDKWLEKWAPDDLKFELIQSVDPSVFNDKQKGYLSKLADKIEQAPADADGEWFHKAVYDFKDSDQLSSQELFGTLYQVLIGKDAGPRAGWFLSILPRDWLLHRLRFEA